MKKLLLSFAMTSVIGFQSLQAQVTAAGTGIDADVFSNQQKHGGGASVAGYDDWFYGGTGAGSNLIDTSLAATLRPLFQSGSSQNLNRSFSAPSAYKLWANVNENLYILGAYARDNVGGSGASDSTSYTNGAKNGENPSNWGTTIGNVNAKSDLVDIFTAFRREGATVQGDLWLQGAVTVDGTNGSRFFDFEYNQTKISFDQTNGFTNLGVADGHTAWEFDVSGNITAVGDLILACEFNNNGLVDASLRLWIKRTDFSTVNPNTFTWGSSFDGASGGSTYGYADVNIPVTAGIILSQINTTVVAAPPWGTKSGSNNYVSTYGVNQLLEFAINLTDIGVDPKTLPQFSDPCLPIYNSFMAKSRSSASFTSALQDFTNPINFEIPNLDVTTGVDTAFGCNSSTVMTLSAESVVANLYSTPKYTWSTPNGSITNGNGAGDSAFVQNISIDQPGTYYVGLSKFDGCPADALDTIVVNNDKVSPIAIANITLDSLHIGNNYMVNMIGGDSLASVIATSVLLPSQGISFNWTGPNSFSSNTKDITAVDSGTYMLIVKENRNNCQDTAFASIIVLPVQWLEIKATKLNSGVEVQWSTASEINCDFYTVQRLNNLNNQWESLGKVSGSGYSNDINTYNFMDINPINGVNFYRILQFDFNGNKHLSEVVFVDNRNELKGSFSVYPNPSNGFIEINGTTKINKVILYDLYGRSILTNTNMESNVLELSNLSSGTYYLKVFDIGKVEVLKLIIE